MDDDNHRDEDPKRRRIQPMIAHTNCRFNVHYLWWYIRTVGDVIAASNELCFATDLLHFEVYVLYIAMNTDES